MEAVTTNAAANAMRRASERMKASSGDIICRPCERRDPYAAASRFREVVWADTSRPNGLRWLWVPAPVRNCALGRDDTELDPLHRHRNLRAVLDGLIDHAITFGEF